MEGQIHPFHADFDKVIENPFNRNEILFTSEESEKRRK